MVIAFNSFEFQRGGRKEKKNLNSSSTSSQHFFALSSFRLFSEITCIFSPQPPLPCSVALFSPFTAGLGYSFRRQTHSVSLLLRVTERQKKKRNGEKERQRGWEGCGRKMEKTKKRQAVPQLCRGKEKRGVNKRRRGKKKEKSLESTSHSERCSVPGTRSLFHSLRSSLNIFSFPLFSPPSLPPPFPAFLFYYLRSGPCGPLRVPAPLPPFFLVSLLLALLHDLSL